MKNYAEIYGFEYERGPFSQLAKPVAEVTVGLITSSGHFGNGDAPAILSVDNMTQDEMVQRNMELVKAPLVLSSIPGETPSEKLRIRHGGYDITPALKDPRVTFPLNALKKLADQIIIGNLYPTAWSLSMPAPRAVSSNRRVRHGWRRCFKKV